MKNLHTELEALKRSLRIQAAMFIITVIFSAFACLICYNLGQINHEKEIVKRAKELPENVDCYTNSDVEKLISGEPKI